MLEKRFLKRQFWNWVPPPNIPIGTISFISPLGKPNKKRILFLFSLLVYELHFNRSKLKITSSLLFAFEFERVRFAFIVGFLKKEFESNVRSKIKKRLSYFLPTFLAFYSVNPNIYPVFLFSSPFFNRWSRFVF